jgi:CPA2 family monovalent cation:H+ antiporter-2
MEHLLLIFLTTIFIATILNVILKRFGLPTIIGYIFSGLAISYIFKIQSNVNLSISHIAEFGIVFLMFTIGLEFSIKHLKSMKKEVFVYGFLQVFISGVLFSLIAHFGLSIDTKSAIILGFGLSLSSTAIVLKVLNENSEIHSPYGRITLGILIFQDLAVIPILLMISIFTNEDQSTAYLLAKTSISAIVLFFIIFVAGRIFIEKFLDWIIESNSEEIFLVSILLIVVSSSFVANMFDFSYSLGAFLAGMTIAETKYRYRVEADLTPFRDILLGIFFVSIGLQIDLAVAFENIFVIILMVSSIMALKGLIIFLFLLPFVRDRVALKSSLALFQIGEFSLAIFALAKNNDLITQKTDQILIMSVVISMIIAPFVLKNIKKIADKFFHEPLLAMDVIDSAGYKDHIIICGYSDLGKKLALKFKKLNLLYVILEHDIKLVEEGRADEQPIILANAAQKSVLEAVNIKESLAIMVAITNAKKLRLICENIASFDADINSIVKVRNSSHEAIIKDLKISHIVNQSHKMAEILMEEAVKCRMR